MRKKINQNKRVTIFNQQKKGCSRIPFSHKNTIFTNQQYGMRKSVIHQECSRLPYTFASGIRAPEFMVY